MDPILLLFSAYVDAVQCVRISYESNLARYSQYTDMANQLFVLLWKQIFRRPCGDLGILRVTNLFWSTVILRKEFVADGLNV
jgi:hypothetical protein